MVCSASFGYLRQPLFDGQLGIFGPYLLDTHFRHLLGTFRLYLIMFMVFMASSRGFFPYLLRAAISWHVGHLSRSGAFVREYLGYLEGALGLYMCLVCWASASTWWVLRCVLKSPVVPGLPFVFGWVSSTFLLALLLAIQALHDLISSIRSTIVPRALVSKVVQDLHFGPCLIFVSGLSGVRDDSSMLVGFR